MAAVALATSDWVDRLSGPCPVNPATRVVIQFRGETREDAERAQEAAGLPASLFVWAIEGSRADIIAYRVVV